jgi:anti-anti-sigma factor
MPEASFLVEVVSGMPVVTAPEEIDITNAAGLRAALLEAAAHESRTLVVDMAQTQFCDSAALNVLVRARTSGPRPTAVSCYWSSVPLPSCASSRSPGSTT